MRYIAWLIIFSCTAWAASAQNFTAIRGGAALSNLKYKVESDNRARMTWFGGLVANFELQEQFFVRTELSYSKRGYQRPATATATKGTISYNYLSIPLLAGYQPVKNLSIMAGPELGYMLSAKAKDDINSSDIMGFVQNRFSVDANAGVSWSLTPELMLDAHFLIGLTSLYRVIYTDANGVDTGAGRDGFNRVLQVGLLYKISGH
jgi:hypothetical protein